MERLHKLPSGGPTPTSDPHRRIPIHVLIARFTASASEPTRTSRMVSKSFALAVVLPLAGLVSLPGGNVDADRRPKSVDLGTLAPSSLTASRSPYDEPPALAPEVAGHLELVGQRATGRAVSPADPRDATALFRAECSEGRVRLSLQHELSGDDGSNEPERRAGGEAEIRVVGERVGESVKVRIEQHYAIRPDREVHGTATLDGQDVDLGAPRTWTVVRVLDAKVGDPLPTTILSSVADFSSAARVVTYTSVAIAVVASSTLIDEFDDEADDEAEDDPCEDDDKKGDGFEMLLATGVVEARVPILQTIAHDRTEIDLFLTYQSDRSYQDSPVGFGWTHSYNLWLESWGSTIVYHDGHGRRNAFTWQSGFYSSPIGRDVQLLWVVDHFEILHTDGTREVFDPVLNKVSSIIDRRGGTMRFKYDTNGTLLEITSANGRSVAFTSDANNRLETVTDPSLATTQFVYDANGYLTSVEDPLHNQTLYGYDASGRANFEQLRNGTSYSVSYEVNGISETNTIYDSTGDVVVRAFAPNGFPDHDVDGVGADIVTVTDGRGLAWSYERDNLGRIRKITAQNGMYRERVYGGPLSGADRNRLTAVKNENGDWRYISWNWNGRMASVTDEAGYQTIYEYNHPTISGLMTRMTEPDGDDWVYSYDATNGDLLSIVDPLDDTAQYGSDRFVSFKYDTWGPMDGVPVGGAPLPGRIKEIQRADRMGNVETTSYYPNGNMYSILRAAGVLDLSSSFEHDANGRLIRDAQYRGDAHVISEYTLDPLGRVTVKIDDPVGLQLTTTNVFDGHGLLASTTDPRGNVTTYDYDERNRMIGQTRAVGTLNIASSWTYDGNGNVTSETLPGSAVKLFVYNEQDFVIQSTDAEGYTEFYDRDGVGNLTLMRRTLAPGTAGPFFEVASEYDDIGRQTARVEAPSTLNLRTEIEYVAPAGCGCGGATPDSALPHKVVDPMGKVRYFAYDELDRQTADILKVGDTSATPDGDDVVTQWEYDASGNTRAVVEPEGERTEYTFDEADRRTEVRVKNPGGQDVVIGYVYDGVGNVSSSVMANGHVVNFTYDGANRLILSSDTQGPIVSYSYDESGNVLTRSTAIAGQVFNYEYDELDRLKTIIDPINGVGNPKRMTYDGRGNVISTVNNTRVKTEATYDKLNRITQIKRNVLAVVPVGDDTANTVTTIAWDGMRRTGIQDHDGNLTTFVYDEALRMVQEINPLENGSGIGTKNYTYTPASRVLTRTDENGTVTTYGYDDLHRVTSRSYSTGKAEAFTYDENGRMLTASNGSVATAMTYDPVGRPESASTTFVSSGTTYTASRTYAMQAGDTRAMLQYPSGRIATYEYDERMRLASIDANNSIGATYGYDDADRRSSESLGNGVSSLLSWDLADRLTRIQHAKDVTTLFDVEYGFNRNGYRTWVLDHVRSDRSEIASYDAVNRVRKIDRGVLNAQKNAVVAPVNDPSIPSTENYGVLDRRGNWKRVAFHYSGGAGIVETRNVNGANEYLSVDPDGGGPLPPSSLTSNDAGDLLSDPLARLLGDGAIASGQTYEYDEEHRLVAVRNATTNALVLEIRYDALGVRVETIDYSGTAGPCVGSAAHVRHAVIGSIPLVDYVSCDGGATWSMAREWVWGVTMREPVAMVDWTSAGDNGAGVREVLHHIRDSLGTVVGLTDATGALVERYEYDGYGETWISKPNGTRIEQSAYGNTFGWTGHRYDAVTKLYHTLFRSYSPRLGYWMQRDPAAWADGINLHQYATANPLNWIDAYGLCVGGCTPPPPPNGGGTGGGAQGGTGGGGTSTGYSVTIHVDQPAPGTDAPFTTTSTGELGDVGHTWVTLTDHTTGETTTAGFYPGGDPDWKGQAEGGVVDPDTGHFDSEDARITYPVTKEGYKKAKEKIKKDKQKKPKYDVRKHNCTDWAIDVAKAAGACPPEGESDWKDPKTGETKARGSSPGKMGEDIAKTPGGQRVGEGAKAHAGQGGAQGGSQGGNQGGQGGNQGGQGGNQGGQGGNQGGQGGNQGGNQGGQGGNQGGGQNGGKRKCG